MSSSTEEGTNTEGEPTNHHQETYILETLIDKFIEDPFGDQLHCLVDDNSSQCSSHPNFNLDFDHTSKEEENFKNNTTSSERQSCHHYTVEEHTCKSDRESEYELLDVFPYQMSDNNEELKEEQSHDDEPISFIV